MNVYLLFGLIIALISAETTKKPIEPNFPKVVELPEGWTLTIKAFLSPHTIFCDLSSPILNVNIKGYKLDLFFKSSIINFNVSELQEIDSYKEVDDKWIVIISSQVDPSKILKFSLNIALAGKFEADTFSFASIYFNEKRITGDYRPEVAQDYSITKYESKCDSYMKLNFNSNCQSQLFYNFTYLNQKYFRGVTVNIVYQKELTSLTSSKMMTTKDDSFHWTLQNLGWEVQVNETVSFNIVLKSNQNIYSVDPIAIVFNQQIICGLPRMMPFKRSLSYNNNIGPNNITNLRTSINKILIVVVICLSFTIIISFGVVVAVFVFINKNKQIANLSVQVPSFQPTPNEIIAESPFCSLQDSYQHNPQPVHNYPYHSSIQHNFIGDDNEYVN